MKPIFLLITAFCCASFTVIPSATWFTNLEKAKSEASQSNKAILLNFSGSDWCAPCIRFETGTQAVSIHKKACRLMGNRFEISIVHENKSWAEELISIAILEIERIER